MTVYVDDMKASWGRLVMCHMLADTDEELHAMADKIGVPRRWHQAPPRHDSHYDICQTKRAKALREGAMSITWRTAGCMNYLRKTTGHMGDVFTAQVRRDVVYAYMKSMTLEEAHTLLGIKREWRVEFPDGAMPPVYHLLSAFRASQTDPKGVSVTQAFLEWVSLYSTGKLVLIGESMHMYLSGAPGAVAIPVT